MLKGMSVVQTWTAELWAGFSFRESGMSFSVNVMSREYVMMKMRRKESSKPQNVRRHLSKRVDFQPENRS